MKQIKCVFCKFSYNLNLIPHQLLANLKRSFIILSLNPQTKGHSLIIPKTHFNRLIDMPKELQGHLFSQAVKLGESLQVLLGAKAYVIKVNNELYKLESSNKAHVGHIHLHVIPRYKASEKIAENPPIVSTKSLSATQKILKRPLISYG